MRLCNKKRPAANVPSSALQQTILDLRAIASDLRRTQGRMAEQVERLKNHPEEQSAR